MLITIAPMVNQTTWEPPYFMKALDLFKNELSNDFHFIIARTNNNQEIQQFKNCIKRDKKNILILLSDEAGIVPPFINELYLVFRTYSNKNLYDNKKIFSVPCGYCFGYNDIFYKEEVKKPLIDREYDIFYSGQFSNNRLDCINNLNKIKNKFKSIINVTDGFARGYNLDEYYSLMRNSKIAIVPNGAVVPESFRYFEAFESNCIVISSFPINNSIYHNWFYDNSPAIFLNNWNELTEELIRVLLTKDNLEKYENLNSNYFDEKISPKAISNYILNIINNNENIV